MNKEELSIRVFHINSVSLGEKVTFLNKVLTIKSPENYNKVLKSNTAFNKYIKNFSIKILTPEEKNVHVNSIMDFIPVSTKVLGEIGYGITHTLTGVVFMLTGCDEKGNQICEFGKSDGILQEKVQFNKAGTPKSTDYIISVDLEVYEKSHSERECINSCHEFCDTIIQDIRECLKKINGRLADERHDYSNENSSPINSGNRKKVIILKQVAGQGAMYDTRIFPKEPNGYSGGYSIIDCMNMPVFISPNEYRDGAIRAMH